MKVKRLNIKNQNGSKVKNQVRRLCCIRKSIYIKPVPSKMKTDFGIVLNFTPNFNFTSQGTRLWTEKFYITPLIFQGFGGFKSELPSLPEKDEH